VLFLDEPTSGVDPIARRDFWDLIYALSEKGHTVFVSTHYMDEAEYCHRLALMYRGSVIALGTPAELKHDLGGFALLQLETADLLGAIEALEGLHEIDDVAVFGSGLHVRTTDAAAADRVIRDRLASKQILIHRLAPITASLEDVFVSLIEAEERK
jgi:ABC-2 type transport system ATP-binding protein